MAASAVATSSSASPAPVPSQESRRWFAVPAPVRNLFNHFPLQVYPAESLPSRALPCSVASDARPRLFVFASEGDALLGAPSFNPSCLKWQTFLRIAGIDVELIPSTNHASPSGALPFLLPPSSNLKANPVTGTKIRRYASEHSSAKLPDDSSPRLEAYQSLLTQNIRPAWLYSLYLQPANDSLLAKLYLPSSPLLATPLRQTLRSAATAEILKTTRRSLVLRDQLFADATSALRALSTLLGDEEWFFGAASPGLFDADVFSYTQLILDSSLGWQDNGLEPCLTKFPNLVHHQERLYEKYWNQILT